MARNETSEDRPRKRVTRRRVSAPSSEGSSRRRVVKKVVKKASPQPVEEVVREVARKPEASTPARKSPTQIAARKAKNRTRRNHLMVVLFILLLGIGGSVGVGITDKGKIDVNQTIEERNERLRSGQLSADDRDNIIVPTQNTSANQLPDGGLVGLGVGAAPPPPPNPVATTSSSTASSTDETASSTDDGTESSESDEGNGEESTDTSESTEETPEPAVQGESISVDSAESTAEEPTSDR